MLTLNNQPPNLDTVPKSVNFKKYSKDIRKFICKCLAKEPTARPTARELIKESFMKKAKSNPKEFIGKFDLFD